MVKERCDNADSCNESLTSKELESTPRAKHEASPNVERPCSDASPIMTPAQPLHSLLQTFDGIVPGMDIPQFLRENDATLRFPEKLMLLIVQAEREALKNGRTSETACLAWTSNGHGIILRNTQEFQNKILTLISYTAKFTSFTRKLYRWGFRQAKGSPGNKKEEKEKNKNEKIFRNALFQRDNRLLTVQMKSTTAEGKRKALASQSTVVEGHQQVPLSNHLRDQSSSSMLGQHPTIERQPTLDLLSANTALNLSLSTLELPGRLPPLLFSSTLMPIATNRELGLESHLFPLAASSLSSSLSINHAILLSELEAGRLLLLHSTQAILRPFLDQRYLQLDQP